MTACYVRGMDEMETPAEWRLVVDEAGNVRMLGADRRGPVDLNLGPESEANTRLCEFLQERDFGEKTQHA
jgi:hypothetical protein